MADPIKHRIQVDSGELVVVEIGQGDETYIVIPGMGMRPDPYFSFGSALNGRVIMSYKRDISPSTAKAKWNHSIFDEAEDIAHIMNALDIENAHICGESLGGMVAMAFALNHSKKVKSLSIVSSQIGGQYTWPLKLTAIRHLAKKKLKLENPYQSLCEVLFSEYCKINNPEIAEAFIRAHIGYRFPNIAATKQGVAAVKFMIEDRLKEIDHPTLIFHGDDDRLVSVDHSQKIHSLIQNSTIKEFKNAGHALLIERPFDIAEQILDWHQSI